MNGNKTYQPIFITGAERSGSTFIAKILNMCGVQHGISNGMYENRIIVEQNMKLLDKHLFLFPNIDELTIPVNWHNFIDGVRVAQMTDTYWMVKHSSIARLWPLYAYAFPNAKWIIVRRRTGDIVRSCVQTGYMKTFKNEDNLKKLNLTKEEEGWIWWVRRYEERFIEMINAGVNCKIVWPERMVTGDYTQMFELVDWLGLKWNNRIPSVIDPLLTKSREEIK
jgi:hypothetical protein